MTDLAKMKEFIEQLKNIHNISAESYTINQAVYVIDDLLKQSDFYQIPIDVASEILIRSIDQIEETDRVQVYNSFAKYNTKEQMRRLMFLNPNAMFEDDNNEESAMLTAQKHSKTAQISLSPPKPPKSKHTTQKRTQQVPHYMQFTRTVREPKHAQTQPITRMITKPKNIDVKDPPPYDPTPDCLFAFIEMSDYDKVAQIIEDHPKLANIMLGGETPLHVSVRRKDIKMTCFLVDHGADISARNEHGSTPLFNAVFQNDLTTMEFLISKGTDINTQNNEGNTPLHYACDCQKLNALKFLITKEPKLNIQNNEGKTALHIACNGCPIEMVLALVHAGADINIIDKSGKKARDYTFNPFITELFMKLNGEEIPVLSDAEDY